MHTDTQYNDPASESWLNFTLSFLLPLAGELRRRYRTPHVYKQLLVKIANEINYVARFRLARPLPYAHVIVVRHSERTPDKDNMYASVKPLLDVMQPVSLQYPLGLGLIAGDSPKEINLTCTHVKAARREGYTHISLLPGVD